MAESKINDIVVRRPGLQPVSNGKLFSDIKEITYNAKETKVSSTQGIIIFGDRALMMNSESKRALGIKKKLDCVNFSYYSALKEHIDLHISNPMRRHSIMEEINHIISHIRSKSMKTYAPKSSEIEVNAA